MNHFMATALQFLSEHYDVSIESGASAAEMIGVNQNTLRARIKKGQALAIRDTEGRERAAIDFTGRMLVFNMLYDRLARFGVNFDDKSGSETDMMFVTDYVQERVLSGNRNTNLILRVEIRDGVPVVHWFDSWDQLGEFSGDGAVVLPVGTLVARLAARLMAKHSPDTLQIALKG